MSQILIPDMQDREGRWVDKVMVSRVIYRTPASDLWYNIKIRCKVGGEYQARISSYVGCALEFGSFQEFAGWANAAPGYGLENWVIDKDLLSGARKRYAPDTCVFLPRRINSFLTNAAKVRGALPVGVCLDTGKYGRGRYMAQLNDAGKRRTLGRFHTPEVAFRAYKTAKEDLARALAEQHKDHLDPRAYAALLAYTVNITD